MSLDRERARQLLAQMVLVRRFEEKCAEVYGAGKIRGFLHLYIGQEAVAVGTLAALLPEDNVVATYREHAHAIVRGTPLGSIMAEMYGKATGCCGGRGGSMHLFDVSRRLFGGNAIVGGGLPLAVGLALADAHLGRSAVTACFFGEGALAEGEFHESLNLAALWKVPVVFMCENNRYAMGTELSRHQASTDLCAKARAYGMAAERVDGMDLPAVLAAAEHAVDLARKEHRPRFLELQTYRFRAHSMYDAELYRSKAEVREWATQHDPIEAFVGYLREQGWISDADVAEIEQSAALAVTRACEEAEGASLAPVASLTRDVYTPAARAAREARE